MPHSFLVGKRKRTKMPELEELVKIEIKEAKKPIKEGLAW